MNNILYVLAGPTASGKTSISTQIAKKIDAEIVCLDSMSIYKKMNIGTAKITVNEQQGIAHHLLDICEPNEEFSVQKFLDICVTTIKNIFERNKKVLLVVGTPLYFKALVQGMFSGPEADEKFRAKLEKQVSPQLHEQLQKIDIQAAKRISINDKKRIIRALEVFHLTGETISKLQKEHTKPLVNYPYVICCLNWQREILYSRIEKRVDLMFEKGLIAETKDLLKVYGTLSRTAAKAIGYKDVIDVLEERKPVEQLVNTIKQNTRRYAKRQMTWWRSFDVHWIDLPHENYSVAEIVQNVLDIYEKFALQTKASYE